MHVGSVRRTCFTDQRPFSIHNVTRQFSCNNINKWAYPVNNGVDWLDSDSADRACYGEHTGIRFVERSSIICEAEWFLLCPKWCLCLWSLYHVTSSCLVLQEEEPLTARPMSKMLMGVMQGFSQDEEIGSPTNFLGTKIMRSTNFDTPKNNAVDEFLCPQK